MTDAMSVALSQVLRVNLVISTILYKQGRGLGSVSRYLTRPCPDSPPLCLTLARMSMHGPVARLGGACGGAEAHRSCQWCLLHDLKQEFDRYSDQILVSSLSLVSALALASVARLCS